MSTYSLFSPATKLKMNRLYRKKHLNYEYILFGYENALHYSIDLCTNNLSSRDMANKNNKLDLHLKCRLKSSLLTHLYIQ